MPYTGPGDDNLPDNIKDLPEDDRAQWVEVWNSAYSSFIDDGGEPDACESSAFAQANGVVLKEEERGVMDAIQQLYAKIRDAFAPFLQQRTMALGRVYQQVDAALYDQAGDEWPWLLDLYLDDGAMYALTAAGGLLYRYPVTVSGETVTLGERQQVTEVHQPVGRGGIRVHRQADGLYRFTLIAATAVLNRVGEIDSRELFANFVRRAEETGDYPVYQFYHQGDRLRIGQVDFLAVDDAVYLASGLYDDEAENRLAGAARRRAQDESDYWGNSIGYNPIGDADMIEVARGVRVPVFRDGVNVEISMLPEQEAAAWFTALRATSQEVRMNQKTKEALERLLADDPDALEEFARAIQVDPRNPEGYDRSGLIYYSRGDYERALNFFEKAAQVDETYHAAYGHMGWSYYVQAEYAQAIPAFEKAIELGADSVEYYYELGLSYAFEGQCERGIPWLRRALEIDPASGPALQGLADCEEELARLSPNETLT